MRLKVKSATMPISEAFWDSEEGTTTCGKERKGSMEKRSFESFKLDVIG